MAQVGRVHVHVQIGPERILHSARFGATVLVADIKKFLAGATGIPAEQQCLSKEKKDLHDAAMISLRNQKSDCELEMGPLMSVVVINVSGDSLATFPLRPWSAILDMKHAIQAALGHPLDIQVLVLGEKILRNSVTLGDLCRIFEVRPGDQLRVKLILSPATETDK